MSFTLDEAILLSPFYLYSNLPPFIVAPNSSDASTDGTDTGFVATASSTAPSQPVESQSSSGATSAPSANGDVDSDQAVADLKRVWENSDSSLADRLCPKSGKITVTVIDKKFDLDASDFADLFKDGATGTKTTKWTIMDQHVDGNEITIRALHTFTDASGKSKAISQTYTLESEDSGFVIREFGSEPYTESSSSSSQ